MLTVAVMGAIVLGLGISLARLDEPRTSEALSSGLEEEPSAPLAQVASPTATRAQATMTPVPTGTPIQPTPTRLAVAERPAVLEAADARPSPIAEVLVNTVPTKTPVPMPTPHENYSWTLKVPILMYHYISQPPEDADQYRLDLSTSPRNFREQLGRLVDAGYEAVDLYDLSLAIVDDRQLPAKPIILTFDDGYRDNYENAFPILQEFGLKATFFVTTEFIDQGNPNYMTWPMIEEMAAAGMRIEPHSKTHPDLTIHDRDFIIWEVLGSQETIADHIGYRPRYFAYPGGRYNDQVQGIVAELDFWGAVTTSNGLWHGFNDRFEWGRVRMRYTTAPAELIAMIE